MSGVPMRKAVGATVGPEDALGTEVKRGDYSGRLGIPGYNPHQGSVPQAVNAQKLRAAVTAAVAAGADASTAVFTAPWAGVIEKVVYVPTATITGAATNNRKIALVNKGDAGSGTTEVAAITFGSGVNATAGAEKALTLSGTPANLEVAAGDQIVIASTKVGTGIADPGGTVFVEVEPD